MTMVYIDQIHGLSDRLFSQAGHPGPWKIGPDHHGRSIARDNHSGLATQDDYERALM